MSDVSDFRLRIDRELLDRLVDLAEKRRVPVTTLILEAVRDKLAREAVEHDAESKARIRRRIERMRNATGHGGITWSREELYRY